MDDRLLYDRDNDDALNRYVSSDGWTNDWAEITALARRKRRHSRIIGVGATALACGVLAVFTVALLPNTNDGPGSTPSAAEGADGLLGATDMVSVWERVNGTETCLDYTITDPTTNRLEDSSDCAAAPIYHAEGSLQALQHTVGGPVLVYGVRPDRSTSVTVRGGRVQQDGSVFSAVLPPGSTVHVTFLNGDQVVTSHTPSIDAPSTSGSGG